MFGDGTLTSLVMILELPLGNGFVAFGAKGQIPGAMHHMYLIIRTWNVLFAENSGKRHTVREVIQKNDDESSYQFLHISQSSMMVG